MLVAFCVALPPLSDSMCQTVMDGGVGVRKIILGALILSTCGVASALETYECTYSKAALDNGKVGQMYGAMPAKVEVNGESIKTFRPDGSFIISPPLTKKSGPLSMADDGSKVYAAANDSVSFAVSDRIAKVTEQWEKCGIPKNSEPEKKPDVGIPVSEKEISLIKSLNGVDSLKCASYLDKRFSQSNNKIYKVKRDSLKKTPFIDGGEITCEVSSNIWNWDETEVMSVEHGVINGANYTLYHSDGSGSVGDGDASWSFGCSKDAITDKKECSMYNKEMKIYREANGYSVVVGSEHFPGRRSYIRVDGGKPSVGNDHGYFPRASGVISSITNNSNIIVRYTKWPYDYVIDTEINTSNFEQAKYIFDRVSSKD
jgi:hypothetical protein